ncbi:MAG: peptide ABC transporter substrate-binding protein [Oceanospirillaceae bacterium]|nr:peptide ABC transporter substrate-binding protein [Oceanospirillaceae bacterium]
MALHNLKPYEDRILIDNKNNFKKVAMATAIAAATVFTSMSAFSAVHPVTGETLAADQTYTYRLLDGIPTMDPTLGEDVNGSQIMRDLFEGLLNQDASGAEEPGVALGYDVSADGKTYTFNLRKSNWSNGDPVTAHDFVYAWQRAVDPKTAASYQWYMKMMNVVNINAVADGKMAVDQLGVKADGDYKFVVSLDAPLPYFASMVTHPVTFPVHKATVEKHGQAWTRPENMVSNGAYKLTEWVLKERNVRERNTAYWNNDATILDKVVALVINDENQALIRYKAGDLDQTEVPAGQYPAMKKSLPNEATSFPRLCNYYYTFNLSDNGPEVFKDLRVRKALSYAIDRDVIVNNVTKGGQYPAYSFTPAATSGFKMPTIDYSKWSQKDRDAKAVALLAEAGYGKGMKTLKFDMLYNSSESHKKIATVMAQMWKQKLGVEAVLANQEWKTFLETRKTGGFQLARGAWCGDYNEASTFLDLVTTEAGYNHGRWVNKEVDQLMSDAKTATDPNINYTRVEQIMAADMPVIPVYHYTGVLMLKENFKGYPINNVQTTTYSRVMYKTAK